MTQAWKGRATISPCLQLKTVKPTIHSLPPSQDPIPQTSTPSLTETSKQFRGVPPHTHELNPSCSNLLWSEASTASISPYLKTPKNSSNHGTIARVPTNTPIQVWMTRSSSISHSPKTSDYVLLFSNSVRVTPLPLLKYQKFIIDYFNF